MSIRDRHPVDPWAFVEEGVDFCQGMAPEGVRLGDFK